MEATATFRGRSCCSVGASMAQCGRTLESSLCSLLKLCGGVQGSQFLGNTASLRIPVRGTPWRWCGELPIEFPSSPIDELSHRLQGLRNELLQGHRLPQLPR